MHAPPCRAVPCRAGWEGLRRRQIGPPVVFSRNAAAADKSFIRLVLRYRARYTLPQQFTQSAQHKDTASQQPPPPPNPDHPTLLQPPHPQHSFFLPLSLSHPPPPTSSTTTTPPLVWSLKAICEPHSCESTLHAGCTNGRRGCGGLGVGWGGSGGKREIKALIHGEGG